MAKSKVRAYCDFKALRSDTDGSTMTAAMDTGQKNNGDNPCRLLNLAAELRNRIYELAFTADDDNGVGTPFLNATGPSKALLITCHQVYDEARGLHKQAFRQYWRQSTFVLQTSCELHKSLMLYSWDRIQAALGAANVNEINHFILVKFVDRRFKEPLTVCQLRAGGMWEESVFRNMLDPKPQSEETIKFVYFRGDGNRSLIRFPAEHLPQRYDAVPLAEQIRVILRWATS